jgi:hypothetical protein
MEYKKNEIKEEDNKVRSLYKVKIEQLENEIRRLKNCCEIHNEKPENAEHQVAYKKAPTKIKKRAKKLTATEYFYKAYKMFTDKNQDRVWTIEYNNKLIQAYSKDKLFGEFITEWYKNN